MAAEHPAALRHDPTPTLEEVQPAAVRCWNRVRVVLPPSDPTDPDDPSVALDTLMAMLHASLTMDEAIDTLPQEKYEALLPLIRWARRLNSLRGYREGQFDDVHETYRLRTGAVRLIGELFDRRRDLYENVKGAA